MRAVAHWQCLPDRLEALGSIPSSEKKMGVGLWQVLKTRAGEWESPGSSLLERFRMGAREWSQQGWEAGLETECGEIVP